jgi:hypothetical protein
VKEMVNDCPKQLPFFEEAYVDVSAEVKASPFMEAGFVVSPEMRPPQYTVGLIEDLMRQHELCGVTGCYSSGEVF